MNRKALDGLSWRMSEVYAACVDQLLINLARHFKFIKDGAPHNVTSRPESRAIGIIKRNVLPLSRQYSPPFGTALVKSMPLS